MSNSETQSYGNTGMRLSVMMFMQFFVWGAWYVTVGNYMGENRMADKIAWAYSLCPIAAIISPFFLGMVADRFFATEKVLAVMHLLGGVALLLAPVLAGDSPLLFIGILLVHTLCYMPTLGLTNSLAFHHMSNPEKQFPMVRVFGTIGWIVAGLALTGWRSLAKSADGIAMKGDVLILAGAFSLLMGLMSFGLPATPPQKSAAKPWAFLEALKMFKDRNFAIFAVISFVVATELQFYYVLTSPFLTSSAIGISQKYIGAVMTIAQFAEIFVMAFLLSWALKKFGMRRTLTLGILVWPIRYIIFVIGQPSWLVVASLALHGFCYVFFFTAAYIYVDNIAPKDIRASAQALIATIILGLGNYVGSLFCGKIQDVFTTTTTSAAGEAVKAINWRGTFLVPTALTLLCLIVFLLFFREKKAEAAA